MITRKTGRVQVPHRTAMASRGVDSGSMCAEGLIINWVRGVIHSQYIGLVRAGVRIKVGAKTDLRVRWARREERSFVVGQPVVSTIPAEAVRLESGMFRRSKQRWNRWVGRIVLIQALEAGTMYTVKVHGEEWTLKSFGPVLGAAGPSRPWDVVNIIVDPQVVELSIAAPCFIVHT
jgi:hypothetical protein